MDVQTIAVVGVVLVGAFLLLRKGSCCCGSGKSDDSDKKEDVGRGPDKKSGCGCH